MSDIVDPPSSRAATDRRVQKTRAALLTSFNELMRSRGLEAISAADIAAHANVGRSTFYEHFDGKDDILAQSVAEVLTPLADCCVEPVFAEKLGALLEHFWQNRQMARPLMSGRRYLHLCKQLGDMIAERLSADGLFPRALVAQQLAHGQLALIQGWLTGRHAATAEAVAKKLHASSYAAAQILLRE
jgi:AcrR family transcriptional regulator